MLRKLWQCEAGFVLSTETVLVATILVIGMITGLATVRDQVVTELADLAAAVSDLDHSYSFSGVTTSVATISGSTFTDLVDFCDTAPSQGADGISSACVVVCGGVEEEGTL
jgi:hypothetical protein